MNNIIISPHKLESIMICPRLYYFKYILNYTTSFTPKYFLEGEFFHSLLEDYYTDIKKNRKQDINFYLEIARNKAAIYNKPGIELDDLEYLTSIFKQYLEYYNNETTWKVIGTETPFIKELWSGRIGDQDIRILLQGKADLLIEKGTIPIIVDHKVVSQNRGFISRVNQNLAYLWALGYSDFIINSIGKQKTLSPDKKFLREYFNYSPYQIEEWKGIAIETVLELVNYHSQSHFPARYTGCSFHGNKCSFYDVCETSNDNWAYKLESNYVIQEDYQSGYFPKEGGVE